MTTLLHPVTNHAHPSLSGSGRLDAIRRKVAAGERLSLEDGDALYATSDIWTVCELADQVRRRLHADAAYYNINRHLNYSNVCALSCKFCEFYRRKDDEGAYTRDMAYVAAQVREGTFGAGELRPRNFDVAANVQAAKERWA